MKKIGNQLVYLCLVLVLVTSYSCDKNDDDGGSNNGDRLTFTKENNADPTLEANQDRITENVWLTRGNNQGLYNAATENSYNDFASPADTEWAFGTTSNISNLTFSSWEDAIDSEPIDNMLNENMVVHLITDDIYLDIKFTAWTIGQGGGGPGGGGFTYRRSRIE
jgi:hypothetical protein